MSYIVLDLEWNQCPAGKQKEKKALPFEIIEIGAVKLDEHLAQTGTFHEIVAPTVYRTLHHMTRQVVTLTEEDFNGKRHFPEVAKDFLDWCGQDAVFCTWGSTDLLEFQRNLAWHKVPSPFAFPLFYCDIQKIFSILYEDRKTRRSLEWAVDYMGIRKRDDFHDAFADACYTADITSRLKPEDLTAHTSIDYYRTPANRKQEFTVRYGTYTKFLSKPFRDRNAAMKDRVVSMAVCSECGKVCRKKVRWFASGSKNYLCLARCERDGWLKGKIRLRQHTDGSWFAIKTHRIISDQEAQKIVSKSQAKALAAAEAAKAAQSNK